MAKIDTGCEENWISRSVLKALDLKPTETIREEFTTFNNKTFSANKIVELTWFISKPTPSNFHVFRVVDHASFQVLLGRKTLVELEIVKINYPLRILTKKEVSTGEIPYQITNERNMLKGLDRGETSHQGERKRSPQGDRGFTCKTGKVTRI
jgi:hypothetical protein